MNNEHFDRTRYHLLIHLALGQVEDYSAYILEILQAGGEPIDFATWLAAEVAGASIELDVSQYMEDFDAWDGLCRECGHDWPAEARGGGPAPAGCGCPVCAAQFESFARWRENRPR